MTRPDSYADERTLRRTCREAAQVTMAETPGPKGMVLGRSQEALRRRCSQCTRRSAGSYGDLETSSVLELGNSSTTLPCKRTRQCQRGGRRTEAASSPHASGSCPGHGEGRPGKYGDQNTGKRLYQCCSETKAARLLHWALRRRANRKTSQDGPHPFLESRMR